jgi:hypothetical protein
MLGRRTWGSGSRPWSSTGATWTSSSVCTRGAGYQHAQTARKTTGRGSKHPSIDELSGVRSRGIVPSTGVYRYEHTSEVGRRQATTIVHGYDAEASNPDCKINPSRPYLSCFETARRNRTDRGTSVSFMLPLPVHHDRRLLLASRATVRDPAFSRPRMGQLALLPCSNTPHALSVGVAKG